MEGVSRLLRALAKLGLILAAVVAAVLFVPPAADYYGAYADKEERLRRVPGERIVVVGGSGVLFGVESTMLSTAAGKRVLNMGLHAGLGLDFMLTHVLPDVRSGDLVILVPEYGILSRGIADEGVIAGALLGDPLVMPKYWHWADARSIARGFPDLALHRIVVDPAIELRRRLVRHDHKFDRTSFDSNGDIDTPASSPPRAGPWSMPIDADVSAHIDELNTFDAALHARGARALFVYSSIPRTVADANEKSLIEIERAIDTTLHMRHVGTPEEAVQPDDNFYDTPNHPNRAGRVIETQRIIEALRTVGELPAKP